MPRDNTRARREGRQPRYLDDFLLELPRRHLPHTIPDQAVGGAISPSHEDTLAPPAGQKQSSPLPEAFLSALREMREDNQQLRLDMQQIVQALSPRASEAPPAPTTSFAAASRGRPHVADSGVSYSRLSFPDFSSTPLTTRQPFLPPADDLQGLQRTYVSSLSAGCPTG